MPIFKVPKAFYLFSTLLKERFFFLFTYCGGQELPTFHHQVCLRISLVKVNGFSPHSLFHLVFSYLYQGISKERTRKNEMSLVCKLCAVPTSKTDRGVEKRINNGRRANPVC